MIGLSQPGTGIEPSTYFLHPKLIWDGDNATNTAVVPSQVKLATLHQADSILAGDRKAAAEAISKGISAQSTGSVSVTYRADARPDLLAVRARLIMEKYLLVSGGLR